jgi:hypothetical protein
MSNDGFTLGELVRNNYFIIPTVLRVFCAAKIDPGSAVKKKNYVINVMNIFR